MPEAQTLTADNPHLAELRALTDRPPGILPALKKIVAVGAVYDPETGFSLRDQHWLKYLFEFCAANRLTIDPEFEIVALNGAQGDFLDPALKVKADILVSCLIPTPEYVATRNQETRVKPGYFVSPHAGPDAWRKAARETGARLIVTYSDHDEIDIADFASRDYVEGPARTVTAPTGKRNHRFVMKTLLRRDWADGLRQAGAVLQSGAKTPRKKPRRSAEPQIMVYE